MDNRGSFITLAGATSPDYRFSLHIEAHLFRGVKFFGGVEGDSYPADFIPELIKYYREGKLPSMYPAWW